MKKKYLKPETKQVETVGHEALMGEDVTSLDVYTNNNEEEVTDYDDLLSNSVSVWEE